MNRRFQSVGYGQSYQPQNRGYYPQYSGYRRTYNQKPKAKHSGAKFVRGRSSDNRDVEYISAWYFRRKTGITSIICSSKGVEAANGTLIYYCKVKNGMSSQLYTGFYDDKKERLLIPEIGFAIYPKSRNGGFCGFIQDMKNSQKNRRY